MLPILAVDGHGNGVSMVTASIKPAKDGLCWHPLVYVGQFQQVGVGPFEITASEAQEYMDVFKRGIPGPAGIPVDEVSDHSLNIGGAFGWGRALKETLHKVQGRTMDAVSAGIEWTELGADVLRKGLYKYVSARFLHNSRDNLYGVPNVIKAGALCTRPLFWWQPEIEFVAAQELSLDELRAQREARSKRWGIEVREDGRLTAAAAYRAACPSPEDYGDPVNLKYPLKPEANLRNAPARFAQNADRYQPKGRAVVYTRIVRALKRAGIRHAPDPALDKLLPPDLRAWVGAG